MEVCEMLVNLAPQREIWAEVCLLNLLACLRKLHILELTVESHYLNLIRLWALESNTETDCSTSRLLLALSTVTVIFVIWLISDMLER